MWPIKINKKLIYIVFTLLWTKRFNELIFWVTESSLNVRRFSLWYKACKCHIYDNVCSSFTVISTSLCGLHKIFIYLTEWVIIWCLKVDLVFFVIKKKVFAVLESCTKKKLFDQYCRQKIQKYHWNLFSQQKSIINEFTFKEAL